MPPLMCLLQNLSHFQGQITLVENILAVCETPGARHILNNTPVKFESFCFNTFGDMRATNFDECTDVRTDVRMYVRTRANLYAPPPPKRGHKNFERHTTEKIS